MSETPKDVDVMSTKRPEKGKSEEYYIEYITSLSAQGNLFDQRCGRIRWLQGHALLAAREVVKQGQKTSPEGQKKKAAWTAFLASIDMPYQTAYAAMRIAKTVDEKNSFEWTWTKMLAQSWDSFQDALDNAKLADDPDGKAKSKGNGKGKKKSKKLELSKPVVSAAAAGHPTVLALAQEPVLSMDLGQKSNIILPEATPWDHLEFLDETLTSISDELITLMAAENPDPLPSGESAIDWLDDFSDRLQADVAWVAKIKAKWQGKEESPALVPAG